MPRTRNPTFDARRERAAAALEPKKIWPLIRRRLATNPPDRGKAAGEVGNPRRWRFRPGENIRSVVTYSKRRVGLAAAG